MDKKQTSNLSITELKESESKYIKKRYKKMTKTLKERDINIYNLIKISILIRNLLLGLKAINIYEANKAGTGFVFRAIQDEKEFQLEANKLIQIFEEMR
ncbi:MAG: hypothetical protein ABF289_18170 [Clostridiales bacterium]